MADLGRGTTSSTNLTCNLPESLASLTLAHTQQTLGSQFSIDGEVFQEPVTRQSSLEPVDTNQSNCESKDITLHDILRRGRRRPRVTPNSLRKITESVVSTVKQGEGRQKALTYSRLAATQHNRAVHIAQTSQDRRMGKERLTDFVDRRREMFLLQFSVQVKKEEIQNLESIAQKEEQQLMDEEQAIEDDATRFDEFIKENDRNSVEAIRKAETETRLKDEKHAEIKKTKAQIVALRSEILRYSGILSDLDHYRKFLTSLVPPEWLLLRNGGKRQSCKETASGQAKTDKRGIKELRVNDGNPSQQTAFTHRSLDSAEPRPEDIGLAIRESLEGDTGMEPLEYFTSSRQFLELFTELEETNLSLIQSCQETEETLEEFRIKIRDIEKDTEEETVSLSQQVKFLQAAIKNEERKCAEMEERTNAFLSVSVRSNQENLVVELHRKVKEVYVKCLGHEGNTQLSTLQMLTSLENKLEHLLHALDTLPLEKIEKAERLKEKERRNRMREDKLETQRQQQEERIQRALERAQAPAQKKSGKPIFFRSAPPAPKIALKMDKKGGEDDNMALYFELSPAEQATL